MVDLLRSGWGCWPDDPGAGGRPIPAGGPWRFPAETITFARGLSGAGGGVPVDAVVVGDLACDVETLTQQLAAYGVARRAPRHRRRPSTRTPERPGRGAAPESVRETTGAVVVTAAGTPSAAWRCWPTWPPGPAWRWPPTSLSFARPGAVRGHPAGGRRRGPARRWCSTSGPRCSPSPATLSRPCRPTTPGPADVVEHAPEIAAADLVARVVSTEEPEAGPVRQHCSSARVVVGAGRGAGGPDGFDDVLELTELLRRRRSASRAS